MTGKRRAGTETRELIIAAVASLITERDPEAVNVATVMRRAGVSRTAFYRQFDSIYDVYASLLVRVGSEVFAEAGSWIANPGTVGSPDIAHSNSVEYARAFTKYGELLTALHDVGGADARLRELWRDGFIQPFIDTTTAAIARDQASGAISPDLDPATTALALTLMGEAASLELLGRQRIEPEAYADIIAPIWISVLFGVVPEYDES
ncbi:MAG: TetR/AcrR family transcriptional regulator [Acidimicrobiia bacterium]